MVVPDWSVLLSKVWLAPDLDTMQKIRLSFLDRSAEWRIRNPVVYECSGFRIEYGMTIEGNLQPVSFAGSVLYDITINKQKQNMLWKRDPLKRLQGISSSKTGRCPAGSVAALIDGIDAVLLHYKLLGFIPGLHAATDIHNCLRLGAIDSACGELGEDADLIAGVACPRVE